MQLKAIFLNGICLLFISKSWSLNNNDPAPYHNISVHHREANGIGYSDGYSSLDFFITFGSNYKDRFFFDLRGHVFNDGKLAANAGLGFRRFFASKSSIFGMNAFYDYRETHHSRFQQVGFGLEFLRPNWDLRLNGYIPVGKIKHTIKDGFLEFHHHRAIFAQKVEFAMYGGNIDLKRDLFKCKYFDMSATLGGYYFYGQYGKDAKGGLFRLTTEWGPYFSLEGQVSYDSLFHFIAQGEAAIKIPFGRKLKTKSCPHQCRFVRKMADPIERFEIIVADTHKKTGVARDPLTGEPLVFLFVDNALGSSNGTIEHPFLTINQAIAGSQPGNVIYVFSGDKVYNESVILRDRQRLIGSGGPLAVTTRFGTRVLPATTPMRPTLTAAGDVITYTHHNTISGWNINGNVTNGLGFSVKGLTVTYNTLNGNLVVIDPSEKIEVSNNNINNGGMIVLQGLSGNSISTIAIKNNQLNNAIISTNFQNTQLSDIDISFNRISAGSISVSVINSSVVNAFIDHNNLMNGGGITHDVGNFSLLNSRIFSNSITTSSFQGVRITGNETSIITADVQKNILIDVDTSGATQGMLFETGADTQLLLRLIDNDSFTRNNATIGYFLVGSGASATVRVQSPDLALTGVASLNRGSAPGPVPPQVGAVRTSGTIVFYPLFPFLQSP